MRVLGIDPGLATIGFGIIEGPHRLKVDLVSCGVIRTKAGVELHQRLLEVHQDVTALIAKFSPEAAAVEQIFFNKNVQTAIAVAQTRGVILLACAQAGLPIAHYTPQAIKMSVIGYGKSTKHQVQQMVTRILKLPSPPRPDDAADAVAAALCYFYSKW